MRWRFAALAAVVLLAALAVAPAARAESTLVVLVRPALSGGSVGEILNRLRGELLADGFSVLLVEAIAESNRVGALTRAGRATDAPLVAGLFVEDGASAIDLCIVSELSGRAFWRRIEVPSEGPEVAPEVLARRTVELLRASVLDFLVASLRFAAAEVRASPASVAAPPLATEEPHWGIEAGLGVLGTFGGIGPAVVPLARVHYALSRAFHLRATGAWLGTQPRLDSSPSGTATVEQGLALLEATAQLWPRRWLRPLFSIGAGTYYVGVNGSGAGMFQGERNTQFALALDAGAGLVSKIGDRLELVLEGHAVVTDPAIGIRFANVEAARIGRPSFLVTLTLAGWI